MPRNQQNGAAGAESFTREQILHHLAGQLPMLNQGCMQWNIVGRQGAWIQLMSPSGQTVQLPALRPPGFLDKAHCPVSPRSEAAYSSLTQELDRLCDLASAAKRRRILDNGAAGASGAQASGHTGGLLGISAGGGGGGVGSGSGGAGSSGVNGNGTGGVDSGTGKPSRFKALSVEVPQAKVVNGRVGDLAAAAPMTLDLGQDGLVLPSPSQFLTSGPQSLGGGASVPFTLDLLNSAKGMRPSPRPDLLVPGQLGRHADGAAAGATAGSAAGPSSTAQQNPTHATHPDTHTSRSGGVRGASECGLGGEMPDPLATPNSSMALNGFMAFSPRTSTGTGKGLPEDSSEGGEAGGLTDGADTHTQGHSSGDVNGTMTGEQLVVQGRGLSKATLLALDSRASVAQPAQGAHGAQDQTAGAPHTDATTAHTDSKDPTSAVEAAHASGSHTGQGQTTHTDQPAGNGSAIDIPIDI